MPFSASNLGRLVNIQTFTTSGTYTRGANVRNIIAYVVAGGGGGGGAAAALNGQPGGGGERVWSLFAAAPASAAVTVGAGGAGGVGGTNGGVGGNSVIAGIVTVIGGAPGLTNSAPINVTSGLPGGGDGGAIGRLYVSSAGAAAAANSGAGGGGANDWSLLSALPGGAGGSGFVLIMEFS
jgi:hypothetical protein